MTTKQNNPMLADEDTAYDMALAEQDARLGRLEAEDVAKVQEGDASVWTGNWLVDLMTPGINVRG